MVRMGLLSLLSSASDESHTRSCELLGAGRVSRVSSDAHSSSSVQAAKAAPLASPFGGEAEPWEKAMEAGPGALDQDEDGDSSAGVLGQVVVQCWPVLGAIFFSGTFFVLAFPFFPYVPSDGTFGQELPRVSFPYLAGLPLGPPRVIDAVYSSQGQHEILQHPCLALLTDHTRRVDTWHRPLAPQTSAEWQALLPRCSTGVRTCRALTPVLHLCRICPVCRAATDLLFVVK